MAQMIARDRFELQVAGHERIPQRGPVILCSNHQSFLDPAILGSLLPWEVFRNTFSVGTSEIFGSGLMRMLAGWLRVVVVDPDANLIPAMRAGAFGLRHGRALILYPEGERSIDGKPKSFKKGAAILSVHTHAPLVPIAIAGFHEAWPRGKRFQGFAPLKMKFGDPIYPPAETEASEAAYDRLTTELRERVLRMWQELREGTAETRAIATAADCFRLNVGFQCYDAPAPAACWPNAFTKASTIMASYFEPNPFAIDSTACAGDIFPPRVSLTSDSNFSARVRT